MEQCGRGTGSVRTRQLNSDDEVLEQNSEDETVEQ